MSTILGKPSSITVVYGKNERKTFPASQDIQYQDILVELQGENLQKIAVTAQDTPVRFLAIRWNFRLPPLASFLGDAWERSYGELQWRGHAAARLMPWYFFSISQKTLFGFGVKTQPAAFAQWQADLDGVTLMLDLRNGADGVHLLGRCLNVATVVSQSYQLDTISVFDACRDFCALMCERPLLPHRRVFGGNNWYYAYGDITHESVLEDCRYLMKFAGNAAEAPYMVVDDGWEQTQGRTTNAGTWRQGNSRFPDMRLLATEMREFGVTPGIWYRPLWNLDSSFPPEWHLPLCDGRGSVIGYRRSLDPSRPEILEYIACDIKQLQDWGFRLIKHDFTSFDLFGRWGFQMSPWPNSGDLFRFHDDTRTSAEIVLDLYRTIRDAAGSSLIIGCNTFGHLAAGLVHVSRIGDDTSGRAFNRTRNMGVNALAFRLCQHNTFFAVDADCVGIIDRGRTIPWECNLAWARLLAFSQTAFFTSIRPDVLVSEQEKEISSLYGIAIDGGNQIEPLDWLTNNIPSRWSINGNEMIFDWYADNLAQSDFF